mgnify:CR=1 FL=1
MSNTDLVVGFYTRAFNDGERELTTDDLLEAAVLVTPLSKAMPEKFASGVNVNVAEPLESGAVCGVAPGSEKLRLPVGVTLSVRVTVAFSVTGLAIWPRSISLPIAE